MLCHCRAISAQSRAKPRIDFSHRHTTSIDSPQLYEYSISLWADQRYWAKQVRQYKSRSTLGDNSGQWLIEIQEISGEWRARAIDAEETDNAMFWGGVINLARGAEPAIENTILFAGAFILFIYRTRRW